MILTHLLLLLAAKLSLLSLALSFTPITNTKLNDRIKFNAAATNLLATNKRPHIVFPGGGIFFYFQAGVITYMREQNYNLSNVTLAGASAGALAATLTACDVDFVQATDLALEKAKEAGVWDRSGGLQGIWGSIIETWLDELLPENAVDLAIDRGLSLLVTPVPRFGKEKIDDFASRQDLIDCNRASVHIPWFLDSHWTFHFRHERHIDGSFLASTRDYLPVDSQPSMTLVLDYSKYDKYKNRGLLDFVTAISPEGIYEILEDGKHYASQIESQGLLNGFTGQV